MHIHTLLCCLLLSGGPYLIEDTGIFYPLVRDGVKVAEDGTIFMLDPAEQVVKRFSADGSGQGIVGGIGEGPGEYTRPWGLFLEGDHFYIRDRRSRKMIVYNLKGEFQHTIAEPLDGLDITRVANGWAQANWRHGAPEDAVLVQLTNNQLEETKQVLKWNRAGTDGVTNIQLANSGVTKLPYNPAKNYALMTPSHDHKTLFIYQPHESFRIAVVDVASGKVHHIRRPELERIPFNEEWGREQLAIQQENYNRRGYGEKLRWTEGFPEYFPWVSRLFAGANNTLVVELWSGLPNKNARYLVLDVKGQDAKLPYKAENEPRILALRKGKAYISAYLEDRASVLLVDLADVDSTVAAYPLNLGGE